MKSIVSNFFYNTMYKILVIILPLITAPYVTRTLGSEYTGIYTYNFSVAKYFVILGYLGFENYGNRCIAKVRENPEKVQKTFSEIYSVQIVTTCLAVLIYALYVLFAPIEYRSNAIIESLYVISIIFTVGWYFFGMERFKLTALRSIFVRLLSFIAIFVFVKSPDDLGIYTAILAGSTLLSEFLLWIKIRNEIKFKFCPKLGLQRHFKGVIVLFFPVLIINIYNTMDKLMLGQISTMSEVGIYEYSDKLVEIPYSLITSLGVVMLPRMTFLLNNGKKEQGKIILEKSLKYLLCIACAMAFGLMAVAQTFAPIYFGAEFSACGPLVMLMAPMIIIRAFSNVIRTQYLIPMQKDKEYIISLVLGMIINLVLNSLFIPQYGAGGAAFATLITEIVVAISQILSSRKELDLKKYVINAIPFLTFGLIMFIVVYFVRGHLPISITALAVEIILGVLIFSTISIVYLYFNDKSFLISIKNIFLNKRGKTK